MKPAVLDPDAPLLVPGLPMWPSPPGLDVERQQLQLEQQQVHAPRVLRARERRKAATAASSASLGSTQSQVATTAMSSTSVMPQMVPRCNDKLAGARAMVET